MNKTITYKKLVRDRIPEIIAKNGQTPTNRTLGEDEFKTALKQKLVEEANEALKADNESDLYKELADAQEVFDALKSAYGIDEAQLFAVQAERWTQRGGFEKRVFLEKVEEHE